MPRLRNSGGPLTTIQPSFICGKAEIFDSPLSVKVRASEFCAWVTTRSASAPKAIIGKDFIGDDGRPVLVTNLNHSLQFALLNVRPRGIVGVHDQHGARA